MQQDGKKSGTGARERLLEAAVDVFGRHGYEGATTRNIAREAGVNIAAIPYYFSGKEGLYRAVINHIVKAIQTQVAGPLRDISDHSFTGDEGKTQALGILEKLLDKVIGFMVGSSQAPRFARIVLREQLYPTAAYELIFKGFMTPVLDALATLIIAVTQEPSRRTAKLRATAIIGQVLAFRFARETVVRALDMKGYDRAETEEIRQVILEHTQNTLRALI